MEAGRCGKSVRIPILITIADIKIALIHNDQIYTSSTLPQVDTKETITQDNSLTGPNFVIMKIVHILLVPIFSSPAV